MLSEQVVPWTQVAREEGRLEGEAAMLLCLIEKRFGPVGTQQRNRIRGADSETCSPGGKECSKSSDWRRSSAISRAIG